MPAFIEIFLTPGVLLLALVRAFDPRCRPYAAGLVVGTVSGLVVVAVLALAIGG